MKKIISLSKRKLVKLVKFARELAIITIGVGIALLAGDFLANRSAKQDLRILLELVKIEMANNIEVSKHALDFYTQEADVANFVAKNVNTPNVADSLMYFYTVHLIRDWIFPTDAFNLLVGSGKKHLIRDKDLLLALSRAYVFGATVARQTEENARTKFSMVREAQLRPQFVEQLLQDFYIAYGITIKMIRDNYQNLLQQLEQVLERLKNLRI